CVNGKDGLDSW
nr:immunoglobulin heavy chain junction region [Macaca mulatta]MOV53332.1 immunoglobulin heavy chain junction region [Macaca mulatta]MOV53575.1 immunoglobulin heavy chain junction region [Macaca mulatta]MOV53587.1 immunoglobulin heavy chain junction region [Macaca mulatta]MOV53890.1 immunoglobulin heavy chain junction region [Macaca mulatta]